MDELETGSFSKEPLPGAWPKTIRLVSWNINRGLRLREIIEFLAEMSADVILLQETDVNVRRTSYCNVPREIARALRMDYVFGREFEELGHTGEGSPAYHGQTTLSRLPLSSPHILRFRRQSGFWRPRWFIPTLEPFQRRLGGRMALITEIAIQSRTLVLYNVHLESRGSDKLRCNQLSEILLKVSRHPADTPVLIGGDFNFDASRARTAELIVSARISNPFLSLEKHRTVQSGMHARRVAIDWILTGGALSASHPAVHESVTASDHFPLSLELRML
jgi:endonuclease/exonuclease/phosphatase family metal-dependent hydrolase